MSQKEPPQHVVIAGAGMIGTATAYYLAKNYGIRTTLIDRSGRIAPAASGKAGGFLALDWNDFSSTGPLTRRSFVLHQQLADDLGADAIQYRRLNCASISVEAARRARPAGKKLEGMDGSFAGRRVLGTPETIAQVHPQRLCQQMWQDTCERVAGSTLQQGKVVGAAHNAEGEFVGAKIVTDDNDDTETIIIEADALLYACGPWTRGLYGIKYHSVVLPTEGVLDECIFFSGCGDPEVYVRPDATAYCTGFPDPPVQVSEAPGQEEVRPDRIATVVNAVKEAGEGILSLQSTTDGTEQACYLPTTEDGTPVMGSLPGSKGCFIAAGHTCWGILMGPGSGESMADLIATGKTPNVDLVPFSAERFGTMIQP